MVSFDEIKSAYDHLRYRFSREIIAAVTQRLEANGADQGPILVRASRDQLAIEKVIKSACDMLQVRDLLIDVGPGDVEDPVEDIAAFFTKVRTDLRVIVLVGWHLDRGLAARQLAAICQAKHQTALVVIYSIEDADGGAEEEIGAVIGNELWREMTIINVEAPALLDNEAIERLGTRAYA